MKKVTRTFSGHVIDKTMKLIQIGSSAAHTNLIVGEEYDSWLS